MFRMPHFEKSSADPDPAFQQKKIISGIRASEWRNMQKYVKLSLIIALFLPILNY